VINLLLDDFKKPFYRLNEAEDDEAGEENYQLDQEGEEGSEEIADMPGEDTERKETDAGDEDYQLGDEKEETDAGDEEETAIEPGDEDYQLDQEGDEGSEETTDIPGEDQEQTTGEADEEGSEETPVEGEETAATEDPKDISKKLVLIGEFKNIYETTINLFESLSSIEFNIEKEDKALFNYIRNKLLDLQEKINFTITKQFKFLEYKKLLTIFYYFQINLNNLSELVEILIQE
jgi:cobalamin biosynthesis protein CobT